MSFSTGSARESVTLPVSAGPDTGPPILSFSCSTITKCFSPPSLTIPAREMPPRDVPSALGCWLL